MMKREAQSDEYEHGHPHSNFKRVKHDGPLNAHPFAQAQQQQHQQHDHHYLHHHNNNNSHPRQNTHQNKNNRFTASKQDQHNKSTASKQDQHNKSTASKQDQHNKSTASKQDQHNKSTASKQDQHNKPTVSKPGHTPDPAASLESLLTSLVACPQAVDEVLGPGALDAATKLLASVSARNKTSTTSLQLFHPRTVQDVPIHAYPQSQLLLQYPLPLLPTIPDGQYAQAAFTHKSTTTVDRVSGATDLTYEKLEFLGDAYIEIIATRLIFSRYPNLTAGRQALARESIVKNETLAQFSLAYDFKSRLQASDMSTATAKGTTKILADVFEAYVAAIVLSDPRYGFRRAEEWLTELWAPILLDTLGPGAQSTIEYNSNAKQELQQKILHNGIKIEYLEDRPMEQTKHEQKYFITLYLTGYGHEKKELGRGQGRNKVEAGNRAAMQAFELNADIIQDAVKQLEEMREQKRLKNEKKQLDSGAPDHPEV